MTAFIVTIFILLCCGQLALMAGISNDKWPLVGIKNQGTAIMVFIIRCFLLIWAGYLLWG